jgi:NADPH:quinone reductase-like Zn-dependent oxidoreductase
MRAVAIDRFGGPEELKAVEVDDPLLGPDGVLIRVGAAGVNPVDTKLRIGRSASRWRHVFPCILGWDAAGTVEKVGPAVTRFAPGDRVLSYCRKDYVGDGAYAELVVAPERDTTSSGGLEMVEAGALPLAGLTAYQCLHDEQVAVAAGETVAVRAASGGVGSMAIQLARIAGARVIGIASGTSEAFVGALGADEFVDYGAGNPVDGLLAVAPGGVDVLVDLHGGDDVGDFARAVRPGGRTVSVLVPQHPDAFAEREVAWHYVFVRPGAEQLSELVALREGGELRIPIAETFALEDAAAAHVRQEQGSGVHGKLVLTVG